VDKHSSLFCNYDELLIATLPVITRSITKVSKRFVMNKRSSLFCQRFNRWFSSNSDLIEDSLLKRLKTFQLKRVSNRIKLVNRSWKVREREESMSEWGVERWIEREG
jgi:hypothetical protein